MLLDGPGCSDHPRIESRSDDVPLITINKLTFTDYCFYELFLDFIG